MSDREELLEALAQARARMQEIADQALALRTQPPEALEARWALADLLREEERAQGIIHVLDVEDLARHRGAIEAAEEQRLQAQLKADELHRQDVQSLLAYRERHLELAAREVSALERIAAVLENAPGIGMRPELAR